MSRNTGTFNFAANFEGLLKAPIDAKQLVGTYADLTTPATWNASGQIWLYNGAMVVVGSDPTPSNNGIYWLCDADNYTMTCSWIKAGTGSGAGTVSGATNGLRLIDSGTTVVLGGNLLSGTTINGQSLYELNLIDLSGFHVSGGTTEIMLVPAGITLTHSGTSVSLDSNAGLTYDADYSPNYNIRSLPDVGFVTGLTSGLQGQINYISGVTDTKLATSIYSGYTGITNTRLDTIEADYITGATNGLSKVGAHDVCLGGTIISSTSISLNSGSSLTFIDNRPTKIGVQYGADYSASFTSNSLITKLYADSIVSGLKPKQAVDVATTGPITLSGLTTIDSITLTTGMRVLVKDQGGVSGNTANGVYSASTGVWGRTSDFDGTPFGEVVSGSYMWVLSGYSNQNTSWVLVTPDPITVGSTPLQFALFNHVQDVTAGTGITVTMIGGNHVISLNTATQTCLANAITGVTNCGVGTSICQGKSGNELCLSTIRGSGGTTVQKIGDDIIICSSSASASQLYSGETPSAVNLCGITIGYQLTGKTVSCIIQDLLVPELFQTSVGTPTTTIGATFTGTLEIGCSVSQTITPTYIAGTVTPLYCTSSPYTRGGSANNYAYSGPSVSGGFNGCTSCVINPYVVTSGVQTWSVCTRYDAGACIRGSKNTVNPTYPTICPLNSCTSAQSASITGILPWYWGTSASGTISGSDVANGTKTVAVVGASTPITFNATTSYLWFAAPTGTYTTKTKWWVCAANAGNIGGTGELWKQQGTVAVTSISGCWAGCSFDVYVTCGITTTATGIPMCLYY